MPRKPCPICGKYRPTYLLASHVAGHAPSNRKRAGEPHMISALIALTVGLMGLVGLMAGVS